MYGSDVVQTGRVTGKLHLTSNLSSKTSSVLGATAIVVLIDLLAIFYVLAHGFSSAGNGAMSGGMNLQLQWLPLIGILLVSLAVFYDAFTRIFPRWLGPQADPLARLKFLRVVAVGVAAFACVLYIPYLLGSSWFWLHLSHVSNVIHPLQGFGAWLEKVEMPILSVNAVWQYSATQVLATAALVVFAWALARPTKRPQRIR